MRPASILGVSLTLLLTGNGQLAGVPPTADGQAIRPTPTPPPPPVPVHKSFAGTVDAVSKDGITVSRPEWVSHVWWEQGPGGQNVERKHVEPPTTRRFALSAELLAGGCPAGPGADPIGGPFGKWDKNTYRLRDVRAGDTVVIWCPGQDKCEAVCITARPFGRVPPPPAGGTWYQELNAHWDRVENGLPRPEKDRRVLQSEGLREATAQRDAAVRLVRALNELKRIEPIDEAKLREAEADVQVWTARVLEEARVQELEEKTAPPPSPRPTR